MIYQPSCSGPDSACYHPLPPDVDSPGYLTAGPKCSTGFVPRDGACAPDIPHVETIYGPAGGIPYGDDTRTPVVVAVPGTPKTFNIADFSIGDVVSGLTQGTVLGLPKLLVVGVAAYFLFFSDGKRRR